MRCDDLMMSVIQHPVIDINVWMIIGFLLAAFSVVSNDKHAKQNSVTPTWKSPFEDECDQDKMDRMREDCEVTHL